MSLKYIIGVDVGNFMTYVSVVKEGHVISIPTESGKVGFPTSVVFDNEMCLVGEAAEEYTGNEHCIVNVKSMYTRASLADSRELHFPVQKSYDIMFMGQKRRFKAQEIMAVVLAQAKNDAERFLGERIKGAVLAVPSYYHSEHRKAIMKAAFIANLPVERLISDTSALMLSKSLEVDGYHVVVDFGSTSFQLAVIAREGGVVRVLEDASCEVGGQTLTENIKYKLELIFKKKLRVDATITEADRAKLRNACEKAKRDLDTSTEALVEMSLCGVQVSHLINREDYELICQFELLEIFRLCNKAVDHPHLGTYNGIIMAGRSAKSFKFLEVMKQIFPGIFIAAESFSVAHGAAKLYAERSSELMEISHANVYAAGSIHDNIPIIFKGARLPTSNPKCYTVPYPSNSFTIAFTVESLLLDSFKVNNHVAYNMHLNFLLGVDINGIFSVTYHAQSHLVLHHLLPAATNTFELIDISSKGLTIAQTSHPSSLASFKQTVQRLRSLAKEDQQEGNRHPEIMLLYTSCLKWLDYYAQQPDTEIQPRLNKLNILVAQAKKMVRKK